MGKPILQHRASAIFGGKVGEWKDAEADIVLSGFGTEFRIKPEPEPDEVHEFDFADVLVHVNNICNIDRISVGGRTFNPYEYDVKLILTRPFKPGYFRSTVSGEMIGWFTSPPECADEWERVEVRPA